jgi:uncharacterized protein DUF6496
MEQIPAYKSFLHGAARMNRTGADPFRAQFGIIGDRHMARRYSRGASQDVERAMRKRKRGTLKSGRSGKKVKSRKQAIAIGLSEARQKGKKVPKRRKRR